MSVFRQQTRHTIAKQLADIDYRVDQIAQGVLSAGASSGGVGGGGGGTGGTGLSTHFALWSGGSGATVLTSSNMTETAGTFTTYNMNEVKLGRSLASFTAGSGSNIVVNQQITSNALGASGTQAGEYPKHALVIPYPTGAPQNQLGINMAARTGLFWNSPSGASNIGAQYMSGFSDLHTAIPFNDNLIFENGLGGDELMRIAANANPGGVNAAALVLPNFRWILWKDISDNYAHGGGAYGYYGCGGIQCDDNMNLNLMGFYGHNVSFVDGFAYAEMMHVEPSTGAPTYAWPTGLLRVDSIAGLTGSQQLNIIGGADSTTATLFTDPSSNVLAGVYHETRGGIVYAYQAFESQNIAEPPTPGAGRSRLYFGRDKKLHFVTDDAVDHTVTST